MTATTTVAFALAVFVFAATPGPAILACVAQAIGHGLRSALALAAGIVLGDALFLLVAVYGLAFLATSLETLFLAVRLAGGAYLVWIGWSAWRTAGASRGAGAASPTGGAGASPVASAHAFRAGVLLTLGNPKVILFYLGFLPAFVDLADLGGRDVVALVALLVVVLMTVNASYAWLASRARRWLVGPVATRRLNRAAGAVLMAAGAYVALTR